VRRPALILLQALDVDGIPDNGMVITPETREQAVDIPAQAWATTGPTCPVVALFSPRPACTAGILF